MNASRLILKKVKWLIFQTAFALIYTLRGSIVVGDFSIKHALHISYIIPVPDKIECHSAT